MKSWRETERVDLSAIVSELFHVQRLDIGVHFIRSEATNNNVFDPIEDFL
jgi:hypothetical protein